MVTRRSSVTARSDRLRDVALMDVGLGGYDGVEPAYPREVGLAYCDGRPPLCWLIEPEGNWESAPATVPTCEGFRFGAGLPAAVVASELERATRGCRVYAESYMPVNVWLRRLSVRSGVTVSFKVRDMRLLVVRPGSSAEALPSGFDLAVQRSRRAVPDASRAVVDAIRHARFLQELSAAPLPE